MLIVAIVAVAMVLLAGIAAVVVTRGDGDGAETDKADDEVEDVVVLEATAVEVPNPFTESVAVDEEPLLAGTTGDTTAPEAGTGAAGGVVKGSAPGLYGGTRDKASCDPDKLVAFLESDEDKAKAWADVQGIEPDEIRSFVAGLTPVVLRRDTRVLNHGYRNGRATPKPAVLQAGTAVLVDEFGIPRAKCNCGNPLAEPRPVTTKTTYRGAKWTGFEPASVVVVNTDVDVSVFVLVDVQTGEPFTRPVGTTGADDADAGDDETPTTEVTESEGTSADVLFEIASIAGVSNGPTAPSVAELPAARITAISTYHWNDAQGATPGTIGLRAADGTMYGPFPTTGYEGQGGVPNAGWTAITNVTIPAGTYTVVDSDPGSWSWAPDTGGRGMVTIWGVAVDAPTPTTPSSGDRGDEAIAAVEAGYCGGFSEYITEERATETDVELYRVEVDIVLDSGEWTALFDVDFATEGGPEIRPVNDESADLLC